MNLIKLGAIWTRIDTGFLLVRSFTCGIAGRETVKTRWQRVACAYRLGAKGRCVRNEGGSGMVVVWTPYIWMVCTVQDCWSALTTWRNLLILGLDRRETMMLCVARAYQLQLRQGMVNSNTCSGRPPKSGNTVTNVTNHKANFTYIHTHIYTWKHSGIHTLTHRI